MNKQQEIDAKRCEELSEQDKDMDCLECSCRVCIAQEPETSSIDADKIGELVSKLDGAAGRLLVAAMTDKTVKDAMEMVSEVSFELGNMV